MKTQNIKHEYERYINNYHGRPTAKNIQHSVKQTFTQSFDTGVSIFLEYRSETSLQEYEVAQSNETPFVEYEVVNVVPSEGISKSASVDNYTIDLNENDFFIESFSEKITPTEPERCCEQCAEREPQQHVVSQTPNQPITLPAATPQARQQSAKTGNTEADKLLDALSAMTSQSNDEIDEAFLNDMKSILSGEKTYDKTESQSTAPQSYQQQQAPPQPPPPATDTPNEHAIFDRIAQNMKYANAYDFGTIELEQRFNDFDKWTDIEKSNPPQRVSQTKSKQVVVAPVEEKALELSSADFLQDLDLIASETKSSITEQSTLSSSNIPLDPGVGGRSIMASALQVGDIIIATSTDDRISRAIRGVTGSQVSHAAIYVGNGRIIHSTDSGVSEWNLDDLINTASLAVAYRHRDMTPARGTQVVQFLRNALANNRGFDYWGLLQAAPSQLLATYCDSMAGPLRDACLQGARSIRPGTDNNDQFYCSELVFTALRDAGLSISTVQPSYSSPQEVVRLSDGILQYVGHLKV